MKILLPEDKKFIHEHRFPIRWGDMDAIGHVNNTNYFRYMEMIRMDWLVAVGALRGEGEGAERTGAIIVNAFCNFHLPIKFPATVVGRLFVSPPSRVAFDTWVTMSVEGDESRIYCTGGATVVWSNFAAEKAVSLPDWMRALLV